MNEAALDAALRAALHRRDCPSTMELGDYQLGLLTEEQQARMESHLKRCPYCPAELSQLSNVLADVPATAPEPNPNWRQVALEHGRAWLDQQTGHWRQVWLSLSSLGSHTTSAGALAGLMGTGATTSRSMAGAMYVSGADAGFEMKIRVMPDPTPSDPNLCRLELDFNLEDRFGDFSGVQVTLFRDKATDTQATNVQGEVSFSGLPCDQIANMSLVVILPEEGEDDEKG